MKVTSAKYIDDYKVELIFDDKKECDKFFTGN
jgi:hypothetical protein